MKGLEDQVKCIPLKSPPPVENQRNDKRWEKMKKKSENWFKKPAMKIQVIRVLEDESKENGEVEIITKKI